MIQAEKFVGKRRYGRLGKPDVDDSVSEDEDLVDSADKTPNTKRKEKE